MDKIRIFRKSLLKAKSLRYLDWATVTVFIYLVWWHYQHIPLKVMIAFTIFWMFCYIFNCILYCWYIVVADDKLMLRNLLVPMWQKEYFYRDIVKVILKYPGLIAVHNIQVIMREKKSLRYMIDLVAPEDYQEIVDTLRAKGIEVEAINLEKWVK